MSESLSTSGTHPQKYWSSGNSWPSPSKTWSSSSKAWSVSENSWQSPEKSKLKFSNEVSPYRRKSNGKSNYSGLSLDITRMYSLLINCRRRSSISDIWKKSQLKNFLLSSLYN